jgi:hypothetical protein
MQEPQLYQEKRDDVEQLIQHYKEEWERVYFSRTSPDVAPADWVSILTRFMATAFGLFAGGQGGEQDRRNSAILAGVNFYKQVLEPVVAQAVNHPLVFNSFIEPAIERALPGLIGGVYDAVARIVGKLTGGGQQGQPAPPPGTTTTPPVGFQPY